MKDNHSVSGHYHHQYQTGKHIVAFFLTFSWFFALPQLSHLLPQFIVGFDLRRLCRPVPSLPLCRPVPSLPVCRPVPSFSSVLSGPFLSLRIVQSLPLSPCHPVPSSLRVIRSLPSLYLSRFSVISSLFRCSLPFSSFPSVPVSKISRGISLPFGIHSVPSVITVSN